MLCTLVILFSALRLRGAEQAPTGSVEGRVFNAATGAALSNARITVAGKAEVDTDGRGAYRLEGVSAGEVRLSVNYVGFQSQTATVLVTAGATTERDFDLAFAGDETVKLDVFTVVADRERSAQAIALNERRNAPNIKQVVAYDEYGDRGDEDIGEFMRFLPGVGVIDGGQTASSITLRGFPDNNSAMQVDGADLASARGNSRTQSLLDVPMANIDRIEVNKVPVPDMPASGLGGSINIISKSGFAVKKPVFNYTVYYITDSYTGLTLDGGPRGPTKKLSPKYQQPSFNFNYLLPVNKKFALSFGASRSWRLKPMERDGALDTQSDWNYLGGFQRLSTWLSLANVIKSWSAQVGGDWKISEDDIVTASVQHRYVSNNIMRLSFIPTYGAGATGGPTFTQGTTANGNVAQGGGANQETGADTTHLTLKYKHTGIDWHLEAQAALSRSASFLNDIANGHFNGASSQISNIIVRGEGTGEDDAQIPVRYSATTAAGVPVDIYNGANYVIGNPTSAQNKVVANKRNARLDFTRQFDTAVPFTLKTGVFLDQMIRDQRAFNQTWTFTPNGLTTSSAKLAGNFDVFDQEFNATAPTIFGHTMGWISLPKLYDLYKAHPDWFVLNQPLYVQNLAANSRRLIETVSAAYVRGDVRLFNNKLLVVGGVRFEKTKDDGQGMLDDITAQYVKDASGNLVLTNGKPTLITTDPIALAKLRYIERGNRAVRSYSDFYPSLNLTYNLTDKLLLRAAYARTIGRPNINNIIPGSSISDPTSVTPTITVNNTGLKPWTADGFDLSLESYQIKGGFGSIGVFQRNISDFFGATTTHATPELLALYGLPDDPLYQNYDITTQTNAGDAKITGFEFAYNQQLLFLPYWARGFQVFLNATRLKLKGGDTADFSGFAPSNYAGGVNFVRPRFSIKLSFTYQGETRQTLVAASPANGIPAGTYNFQGERLRVGINAQYSFSKRFAIYGSMSDLNGPGFIVINRQYAPGTAEYMKDRRRQELGSIIQIGIKGQF